ncbi:DUF86 domain-containing protein [Comamonas faecalis]|uniref:DUF86 domain-containing protein n=1 Tax=Comamonas faecalis TaxID=1387849 RepID=A0ABP7RCD1_9BURK
MSKADRVGDYLSHMLTALERIERYTADMDEAQFMANALVQDAALRNIEIIGEAANNIQRAAPEFAAQHSEVPWLVVYTMRNRITHGYDSVDLAIVWRTIRSDLPALKIQIERVRASVRA